MLKLDNLRTLEGHDVHGDDDAGKAHVFYVMPKFPRISRLETGGLALRFVEYTAIRKVGDSEYGGFVAFDADLTILPETEARIRQGLQQEVNARMPGGTAPTVVLQTVPWISGKVKLNLEQDDKFIKAIHSSLAPSLTTGNTAVFFMELDVVATAIFKDALSSGSSSAIQVIYDLDHYCRLPESHAWGTWHADKFYSFWQDVNIEESIWSEDSYSEVQSSSRYSNEVTETHFELVGDPSLSPEAQADFEAKVHEWIRSQLEEGVKRNLLEAIAPVDPSVKELTEDQDFENVTRSVSNTQISDVRVDFTEAKAIVRTIHPQGSLPSVTSLQGPDGQPLKWEDYYSNISVDEFLRTLQVSVRVSTKLEPYGIALVKVVVRYPHGDMAKTVDHIFSPADQDKPQKSEFIVANKIRKYFWSYEVHFEGDSPTWVSEEVEAEEPDLVVKLQDLPVLKLDVVNGDINFSQVAKARVRVRYEGGVTPIERFFNFTKADETATHSILEVIGRARTGLVSYQTTYTMVADGREITGPMLTTDADIISIDDPFRALRTVTFSAVGNLADDIVDITVQARYEEPDNGYRQDFTVILSGEGKTTDEWTFATIDESHGQLSYRASIRRHNGTTSDVDVTDARGTMFDVGDKFEAILDVSIIPALLDWTKLKLVNVSMRYDGATPPVTDDFLFRPADTETKVWTVPVRDEDVSTYSVTTIYFLLDGTRKTVGPDETTGESVFLELPA